MNEVVSELLWCRDILEELGYPQQPIAIREDNQSCITMLQQEPRNFQEPCEVGLLPTGVCQAILLPQVLPYERHACGPLDKASLGQYSQPSLRKTLRRCVSLEGRVEFYRVSIIYPLYGLYIVVTTLPRRFMKQLSSSINHLDRPTGARIKMELLL